MGWTQFSVALMVFSAVKCLAMSYDELEDFADYIKRTSQLSPILKKGVEADESDTDDAVSDDAWEESGKFEGDLILNDRQRRLIVENVAEGLSRNGLRDGTKRWPNGEVIFYIQVEHFSGEQIQAIQNGIDDLARASCIKFRRYKKGDRDAVVIQGSRRGCFSQVGYQGGYQVLNLSGRHPVGRGCFRHGTIVHEMLHTLGFYHMQSSPDRDDYVNVQWENIVQKARHNFRKYNSFSVSNFGVGYDYESVLHYSRRAFSANGQDTIVPKKVGAEIGQRVGLSDKDVLKLNRMYCDADADAAIPADEHNIVKKKSSKNQPLDIYGIGYHQGKAVIIKVLPKTEEHKLPEVPTSYVFDYFSKASQILSPKEKEGFRVGKEIAQSYEPHEPINIQEYKVAVYNKTVPEKHSDDNRPLYQFNDDYFKYMTNTNGGKGDVEIPTRIIKEEVSVQKLIDENEDTTHPALIEPFDRLSKIIKSHVYPSQDPDLSIYKSNEPDIEYEDVTDEDEKENLELPTPVVPIASPISQAEKTKSAVHFINNLFNADKYQSLQKVENHYYPKTTVKGYYADDNKNNNKKQEILIIAEQPYKVDKDGKYVDPSQLTPFLKHENEYQRAPHFRHETRQETVERHSPKIFHSEKPHHNHDEWHHSYAPYKYNPSKYDVGDNTDYLKHSIVRDGYYSPLGAIRIKEYLVHNPYVSDKYNVVSTQEER